MKNNIKYIISLIVLTAAFICLGNMVMAENHKVVANEAVEEKEVIKAEDIGIKTVEKVISEEQPITAEVVAEDKTVNENSVDKNLVYKEEAKSIDEEESIEDEPACEPLEVPEGLFEGYEEGIYFEPNCFDCELHEYCYKCEEHEIEIEYFWDEEINPNEGWVRSETCIICGHGGCELVTEEEIE